MDQINRVKDLPVPDFGSLIAWEARAAIAARENGELNPNDPLRSQGGYGSTPMPFLGETKVINQLHFSIAYYKFNASMEDEAMMLLWNVPFLFPFAHVEAHKQPANLYCAIKAGGSM